MLFAREDYLSSTADPVSFPDIEAGVLYMARFLADPSTIPFGPGLKTFWSRLVDPNRVHHIFADREGHQQLHNTPPTDLHIIEVVLLQPFWLKGGGRYVSVALLQPKWLQMLYFIAKEGTEIGSNLHAAFSLNWESVVVVQTWEGSLTDAWVKDVSEVIVKDVIGTACLKEVTDDSLAYPCVMVGKKLSVPARRP